jgi:hypothetical protein
LLLALESGVRTLSWGLIPIIRVYLTIIPLYSSVILDYLTHRYRGYTFAAGYRITIIFNINPVSL